MELDVHGVTIVETSAEPTGSGVREYSEQLQEWQDFVGDTPRLRALMKMTPDGRVMGNPAVSNQARIGTMTYQVTQRKGWVIFRIKGKARNNEPLRAKRHLLSWLNVPGVRIVVDLSGLEELGVWEMGLLNSLRKEVDLLKGTLRLSSLNPTLKSKFKRDRFAETFDMYPTVDSAIRRIGGTG